MVGSVPQLRSALFGQHCFMKNKKAGTTRKSARPTRPQAATGDVLGAPLRHTRISPKWRQNYRRLEDLREFFSRQKESLAQNANEETPTYSEHMADAGTDSYDRDFALGVLSSDQNALYEIDAALHRIETGAYGVCELSGKPIPLARLEAIPWARFTLDAEKQLERRGVTSRAHLGNLGSLSDTGATSGEAEEINADEENA